MVGLTVQEVQLVIDAAHKIRLKQERDSEEKQNFFAASYVPKSTGNDEDVVIPNVLKTVILFSQDSGYEALAIVDNSGGETYEVKGWTVTTVSRGGNILGDVEDVVTLGEETLFIANIDGGMVVSEEKGFATLTKWMQVLEQEKLREQELQQQRAKHERELAAKTLAEEQARIKAAEARRIEQQRQKQIQQEQELKAQRLRQEQVDKQREEAKLQQQAVDKYAAQYEQATEPFEYEKAVIQLKEINYHIEAGASSQIILERVAILRSRCMKSLDAVSSANAQAPVPGGEGAAVGAIIGGVLGIFGGLPGIAFGAVAGGWIGKMTDQPSNSPEQKQWMALMHDIDELVSKLPE